MDVKYGKSMASLAETDVAEYLKTKHPEVTILTIPLSPQDVITGYGIGVNKNNAKLYKQVEQAVQELKDSGELKTLENQWFIHE
jgi:ABC-type amino acid transport substrate-binding protein